MVDIIVVFFITILLILLFFFRLRNDAVDVSPIQMLRLTVVLTMLYWFITGLLYGYYIVIQILEQGSNPLYMSLIILLTLLLSMPVYAFFRSTRLLSKNLGLVKADGILGYESIRTNVDSICRDIGVNRYVNIYFSHKIAIPEVFESWNRKVILAIPTDMDGIINGFINDIRQDFAVVPTESDIERYLLLHELSHIKNRDTFFRQFVKATNRYSLLFLCPSLAIIILLWLTGLLLGDYQIEYTHFPDALFPDISSLIPSAPLALFSLIFPLLILIGSDRILFELSEYLADVRASRYIPSRVISLLTDRLLHPLSILGLLFLKFSILHKQRVDKPRIIKIPRFLTRFRKHPKDISRTDALRGIRYIIDFPNTTLLVLMGLWLGLQFVMGNLLGSLYDEGIVKGFVRINMVMSQVTLALIFCSQWKNIIDSVSSSSHLKFIGKILHKYLVSFIAYFSVFIPICVYIIYAKGFIGTAKKVIYSFVSDSLIAYIIIIALSIAFAAAIEVVDTSSRYRLSLTSDMPRRLIPITIGLIMPGVMAMSAIFLINQKISWHYFLFFLASSCLLNVVLIRRGMVSGNAFIIQIHRKVIVFSNNIFPWHFPELLFGLISGFLSLVIPIITGYLFYVLLYPLIPEISLILWMVIMTVLFSIVVSSDMADRSMKNIVFELQVKRILDIGLTGKEHTDINKLLKKARLSNGSYVINQAKYMKSVMGTMEATNAGLIVNHINNGKVDDNALNWILSLESADGGFPVVDKVVSGLQSTYHAISSRNFFDRLNELKYRDKHIAFVTNHESFSGGFIKEGMKKSSLDATFWAISSLNMLGAERSIMRNIDGCADWVFTEWQRSDGKGRLNFEEMYYLVYCLQWLDCFNGEKKDRILNEWLPDHRNIMLNTRHDVSYDYLYYYINILDLLNLHDNDMALEKARDFLMKDTKNQTPA